MKIKEIKKIWGDSPRAIWQVEAEDGTQAKTWENEGWIKTLKVGDAMPGTEKRESKRKAGEFETWLVKMPQERKSFGSGFQAPKFSPDEIERAKMPSFCVSYAKDLACAHFEKDTLTAEELGEAVDCMAHRLFDTMQDLRNRLATSGKPDQAKSATPPASQAPAQPPVVKKNGKAKEAVKTENDKAPTKAQAQTPETPKPATSPVVPQLLKPIVIKQTLEAFAKLDPQLNQLVLEQLLGSVDEPFASNKWTDVERAQLLDIYTRIKTTNTAAFLARFGVTLFCKAGDKPILIKA